MIAALIVFGLLLLPLLCYFVANEVSENSKKREFFETYEPVAATALAELDKLTAINNRFTDDLLKTYRSKYKYLADATKSSPYSSTTIQSFLNKYDSLDEIQKTNLRINDCYSNAVRLAKELNKDLDKLLKPDDYLNNNRIESFFSKWHSKQNDIIKYLDHFTSESLRAATSNSLSYLKSKNILTNLAKAHNKTFVNSEISKNKEYFDSIFAYPLDEQQRRAVVTSEDNNLIVASAGSGKTSTITAKVKYLVEKRRIKPSEILVVTYTRKAAAELQDRVDCKGVTCSTFHAHALNTIGRITGAKPTICDNFLLRNCIEYLMRNNTDFFAAANKYLTEAQNLMLYEHDYENAKEHALDLQRNGKMVPYPDMDGERIYVRSREEREIAIHLTELGVDFRYEEPYPYPTANPKHRQYKPDFSIHFKGQIRTGSGIKEQHYVSFLEHFGIDANGNVPRWFGDGKKGGYPAANKEYNDGIIWKKELHKRYKTVLFYTTSADFKRYNRDEMRSYIENMLHRNGIPTNPISEERKHELIKMINANADEDLAQLLEGFITLMKANEKTIGDIEHEINKDSNVAFRQRNMFILKMLVAPLYSEYQKRLKRLNQIDFTDSLIQCAELCKIHSPYKYKYILVDEFQDMSADKRKYLQSLRTAEPFTKLFCVGDDWQSIYKFSGSDITLFYEFEKFFGFTERCMIETTHRFGEPLLSQSSNFIQSNPEQLKKNIRSTSEATLLKLIDYDEYNELNTITEIVEQIPKHESIYILGRYKSTITTLTKRKHDFSKDVILNIAGHKVRFLTIHSAKGLEADHVIVLGCNNRAIPSIIQDDPIMNYVLSGADGFKDAEERRVFYVAMTRARKTTYLIYDKRQPSYFIGEFGAFRSNPNQTSEICQRCKNGNICIKDHGITKYGNQYVTLYCSNPYCDYVETLFSNTSDISRYLPYSKPSNITFIKIKL